MTQEEITRQKAEETYARHLGKTIAAITEALNTINWIPIDPDNLPSMNVLCTNGNDLTKGVPYFRGSRVWIDIQDSDVTFNVTHYAHLNLPDNE